MPSAVLSVFYNENVLHLTLDSGCTGNIIRLNVVERLNIPIKPTNVKAKMADDKTYLEVVGEISIELQRGKISFKFDAIVVRNLGPDVLAGTPFQKVNDVMTDFVNEIVIIQKKIRYPFTSTEIVKPTADTFIVRIHKSEIILPGDFLHVRIPETNACDQIYVVESRQCSFLPFPMEIESVGHTLRIPNTTDDPIEVKKNSHLQIRRTKNIEKEDFNTAHEYPRKPNLQVECNIEEISIDPSNKLFNEDQRNEIREILNDVKLVFHNDDSTYKGNYKASFEFSSDTRPVLKNSKLPSYSSKHNSLLQQKCDKLWSRGKIVPISMLGVQPNCLNQPFLVKKQKAMNKKLDDCTEKDTRMVTSFGPLAKLVKKNVSKVTTEKEVWSKLAQWNFIAESDLTDSFHQLELKRNDTSSPLSNTNIDCPSYMCFKTPYKGIFAYVTGAQGMPGMSEHLDNVLDATIGDLVQQNKAFKIHDQIYIGGQDFESFKQNIKEVFHRLGQAGLRLGADKTIIGVYSSVIYGKLWQNGTLTPSQHKITSLARVPLPTTVGKLRSFIQGAKINSECLEGLASALAPFGKLVGSDKNKHEKMLWTPSLEDNFYKAQEILRNPASITIPKPSDKLMIIVDSATKPEPIETTSKNPVRGESASSATLLIRRKGENKTRIGGYFSFQIKSGMLPCEAEGKGLERAVQHWEHYIRENEHPTVCLVDNNSVVQCARKLCNGEYSESPRLQSFLYLLNSKNINIQHNSAKVSNKFIENVDWGSRNYIECKSDTQNPDVHENWPYCQLAWKNNDISFAPVRFSTIKKPVNVNANDISVQELLRNSSLTPYRSRSSWLSLQKSCPDMRKAAAHIKAGTVPSAKEKNLRMARYYIQHCRLTSDGLMIHEKQVPLEVKPRLLIVVPQSYLKAIIHQLHTYCETHTSELQTETLFNRIFWAINTKKVIKEVISSCQTCLSTKLFPRPLLEFQTETKPTSISSHFAADVMVKGGKFLVLREILTSHTSSIQVLDEKADSLRDGLMSLLAYYKTFQKVKIRTDNQSGLVALVNDKLLKKMNIELIPGDVKNVNKNPVAERAIREIEDEILKIQSPDKQITQSILAQATMAVNNKIRYTGYTANELLTNTNSLTGEKLKIEDHELSDLQYDNRQKSHDSSAKAKSTVRGSTMVNPIVDKGDLVMIKSDRSKHEPRQKYVVVEVDQSKKIVVVQKFVNNQVRAKKYKVKIEQIILVEKGSDEMCEILPEIPDKEQIVHQNLQHLDYEDTPRNEHILDNHHSMEIEENDNNRSSRRKPRLDYSKLNKSGEKVVKIQKLKIDWNAKCFYCHDRQYSNFYHDETECERKHTDDNKSEIEDDSEWFMIFESNTLTDGYSENNLHINFEAIINNQEKMIEYDNDPVVESRIRKEIAAIKIQTWWRKALARKIAELWDASGDPPTWGCRSNITSCLDPDSDGGVESLFDEIEIERNKLRSKNIADIINKIEEEMQEEYVDEDVGDSNDEDNVFEETDISTTYYDRDRRTSSVKLNVYGDASCRAYSEEFFISQITPRNSSINETEFCRLTRSKTKLLRVPLDSTPLKEHLEEQLDTPDHSSMSDNDT